MCDCIPANLDDVRALSLELSYEYIWIADENSSVPIVMPFLNECFREFKIWLLQKSRNGKAAGRVQGLSRRDIAITSGRIGWFDSKGNNSSITRRNCSGLDGRVERIPIANEMVGGHDHNDRRRVGLNCLQSGERDRGCCTTSHGLENDGGGRDAYLSNLLGREKPMFVSAYDDRWLVG